MAKFIVSLTLLFASGFAFAEQQTIVELPPLYNQEDVQAILRSIDYMALALEADKSVPGLLEEKVGFGFQPLIFHSILGKPDHMVLRVDVLHAPPKWGKEPELKAYLAKFIEQKIPGARITAAQM